MRRWCDVADVANLSSCCVIIQLKRGEKKTADHNNVSSAVSGKITFEQKKKKQNKIP